MLRVPISEAQPGMRLAMPILHPRSELVLLTHGFELDSAHIDRLRDLHVGEVWIDYPGTELIGRFVSPVIVEQRGRLVRQVAEVFEITHRGAHARLDYGSYRTALGDLVGSLVSEPLAAAYITEMAGSASCELRHASEVCLISLLLGLKLEGYLESQRKRLQPRHARNVIALGLGAMLHDVGKTRLPAEIRRRYDETRDQADRAWRKHVLIGHKMVTGSIEPAAAGIILHHHQRFDGSGFPGVPGHDGVHAGLAGEAIHVFARIVSVANHFDRLRRRGDGSLAPRVRVLREMILSPRRSWFDPVVLEALLHVVPAYAPGSVVTLNTGERAVVMDWKPDRPCRPLVHVVEPSGPPRRAHRPRPEIDLVERPDFEIAMDDGSPVAECNFEPPQPGAIGRFAA